MIRIFLAPGQIVSPIIHIEGQDHQHLARVLRIQPGETILLLDSEGKSFQARVETVEKHLTTAKIECEADLSSFPEPNPSITVAQALGKGDKFEQVLQHGTEAGASGFIPVRAERCTIDLPETRVPDRMTRWRQILKGAAEQSGRTRLPTLGEPMRSAALFSPTGAFKEHERILLLHPDADTNSSLKFRMSGWQNPARILILIGPEGGWSPAEVEQAQAQGAVAVSLGPRILRTETAALVAISQILYHWQN